MNILRVLLLIGIGNSILAVNINTDDDKPPLDNLEDRDDMGKLESCTRGEACDYSRKSTCANAEYPYTACGNKIWREEHFKCFKCPENAWIDGEWGECIGTGCNDTVQHLERKCANIADNTDCKSIQTRYCNPSDICHGTWSTWTSDSLECQNQCGDDSYRVLHRTCMKDGKSSISCESKNTGVNKLKVDTSIDDCSNISCRTTTTESSTTTRKPTILTAWSSWKACTANCENKIGMEKRTRKCVYESEKDAPDSSCGRHMMEEERACAYTDIENCKRERKIIVKNESKITTPAKSISSTIKPKTNKSRGGQERFIVIPSLELINKEINMTETTTTKSAINGQEKEKWQYKVLVIVLATTALLILAVIGLYVCCGKRKKKAKRKRKKHSISVVELQSHTGFMDGMEAYGFTKSMMPKDDVMTALNPKSQSNPELNVDTYKMITSTRNLPEIPVEEPVQVNQNSHHVYEDMRHAEVSPRVSSCMVRPMSRSMSYHERRRAMTLITSGAELQPLRRHSRLSLQGNPMSLRHPPVKPPRKSLFLTQTVDVNDNREMREVPKSLYESKEKIASPDLDFIHDIQPPACSPPLTPINSVNPANGYLTLPNRGNKNRRMSTHSAPVSPHHYPMGSPFYSCMPNSLLMPYGGMPIMAPVQNQNGEVVYMPIPSIYSPTSPMHMSQTSQVTPLHGAEIRMRNNSGQKQMPKPRPRTTILPQISISEVDIDKNHLSPQRAMRSPLSSDYAEMRHLPSTSEFEDPDLCFVRSRSFRQLHGTHNKIPSHDSIKSTKDDASTKESDSLLEEDDDGYLAPNSRRTPDS